MSALLDTVLETIRTRRDAIEARYGVRLIGVVGSVARGEERSDSDIDLIFEVRLAAGMRHPSLWDVAHIGNDLEDMLGRPVDLVDPSTMRPSGQELMLKDLVAA